MIVTTFVTGIVQCIHNKPLKVAHTSLTYVLTILLASSQPSFSFPAAILLNILLNVDIYI